MKIWEILLEADQGLNLGKKYIADVNCKTWNRAKIHVEDTGKGTYWIEVISGGVLKQILKITRADKMSLPLVGNVLKADWREI